MARTVKELKIELDSMGLQIATVVGAMQEQIKELEARMDKAAQYSKGCNMEIKVLIKRLDTAAEYCATQTKRIAELERKS